MTDETDFETNVEISLVSKKREPPEIVKQIIGAMPTIKVKSAAENFHEHLDVCSRCEQHPFNLCPLGARLLQESAEQTYNK